MILCQLGAPLRIHTNERFLQKLLKLGHVLIRADPLKLHMSRHRYVFLSRPADRRERSSLLNRGVFSRIIDDLLEQLQRVRSNMRLQLVARHDAVRLDRLLIVAQILDEVRQHLLETAEQVFHAIQRHEVLLLTLLVQVATEIIADTLLHDPFFDLWKIVLVEMEILNQLSGTLTVVIVRQRSNQFDLELVVLSNKHLRCFDLIHINETKSQV